MREKKKTHFTEAQAYGCSEVQPENWLRFFKDLSTSLLADTCLALQWDSWTEEDAEISVLLQ